MAEPHQSFWVNGGPVLRSLIELANFLEVASREQYAYHTKRQGNDFAAWVEGVLNDGLIAAALRRARTPAAALRALRAHLRRHYKID